ncbi:unnamed protein product [Brassica oleracea var. botrytis]
MRRGWHPTLPYHLVNPRTFISKYKTQYNITPKTKNRAQKKTENTKSPRAQPKHTSQKHVLTPQQREEHVSPNPITFPNAGNQSGASPEPHRKSSATSHASSAAGLLSTESFIEPCRYFS